MAVHVDKSRRHDQPGAVDDLGVTGDLHRTHAHNPAIHEHDAARTRLCPRSVDQRAVTKSRNRAAHYNLTCLPYLATKPRTSYVKSCHTLAHRRAVAGV